MLLYYVTDINHSHLLYSLPILDLMSHVHQASGRSLSKPKVRMLVLKPERKMFGITLRPESVKLLEEVERKYGKKVREEPKFCFSILTRHVNMDSILLIRKKVKSISFCAEYRGTHKNIGNLLQQRDSSFFGFFLPLKLLLRNFWDMLIFIFLNQNPYDFHK